MNAQSVVDYIFEIAPNPSGAAENEFLFGDGGTKVTGIAVAWWITHDMLPDMAQRGLTLGISHERVTFEPPQRFVWGPLPRHDAVPTNAFFARMAQEHRLAIHQMHSNVDKAPWGMPHALFVRLGWQDFPVDWSRGVPVITLPPRTLRDFIAEVKAKLNLPFVRFDGNLDRTVSRVAVPWGGLCQWWGGVLCPLPLGFDVVMGGDIIDGIVRLARSEGWAVVDAMHHTTEMDAMRLLAEKLSARFPGVPVRFYENTCPWQIA